MPEATEGRDTEPFQETPSPCPSDKENKQHPESLLQTPLVPAADHCLTAKIRKAFPSCVALRLSDCTPFRRDPA